VSERLLIVAVAGFAVALPVAWLRRQERSPAVLAVLALATIAAGASITLRWIQVGYGPFLTLHEVLLSNVFSLGLLLTIAAATTSLVSRAIPYALAVVLLIGVWSLVATSEPARLPATFDSPWLWLHVGAGKLFLGLLLVAVGLAVAGMVEAAEAAPAWDQAVWRFGAWAFVFQSAMLITGALWANHAWGRYWDWDPVETWALITWLSLGLCLHARVTWRVPERLGRLLLVGVFLLAFLTLFGMPFLSIGPHKGIL